MGEDRNHHRLLSQCRHPLLLRCRQISVRLGKRRTKLVREDQLVALRDLTKGRRTDPAQERLVLLRAVMPSTTRGYEQQAEPGQDATHENTLDAAREAGQARPAIVHIVL